MRILISHPDTIGDMVLRQPMLAALAEAGHELLMVVRPSVEPLARQLAPRAVVVAHPEEVYALSPEGPWEAFEPIFAAARTFGPAALVVAPYRWTLFEEELARRLPDVPRVGMSGNLYRGDPYAGAAPASTLTLDGVAHVNEEDREIDKNAALASVLLGRPLKLPDPRLAPSGAAMQEARRILEAVGLAPGAFWAACVGGTAHVAIKTWPAERWGAALSHWAGQYGRRFAFVGLPEESEGIEAVRAAMGASAAAHTASLAGRDVSIDVLQAVVALSVGYVGHDTGPMHVAAALAKPVLAVFGGGTWLRFLPAVEPSVAIAVGVPCVGCGWVCPFDTSYCIKSVPVEEVTRAIDDLEAGRVTTRESRVIETPAPLLARLTRESARAAEARLREAAEARKQLATAQAALAALAVGRDALGPPRVAGDSPDVANGPAFTPNQQPDADVAATLDDGAARPMPTAVALKGAQPDDAVARITTDPKIPVDSNGTVNGHAPHADVDAATKVPPTPTAPGEPMPSETAPSEPSQSELIETATAALREQVAALSMQMKSLAGELDHRVPRIEVEEQKPKRPWRQLLVDLAIGRQHIFPKPPRPLPPVSVVIPVTGDLETVRQSVESVLAQDYHNLELLLVDDGRVAGLIEYAAGLVDKRVRLLTLPGVSTFELIHFGLSQSYGQVLAFVRPGVTYEPGAVRRAGELFRDKGLARVAYFESVRLDDRGWKRRLGPGRQVDTLDFLEGEPVIYESIFWRRKAYQTVGGLNPDRGPAADWDLAVRTARMFGLIKGNGSAADVPNPAPDPQRAAALVAARSHFLGAFGALGRARCTVIHRLNHVSNAVDVRFRAARLMFPSIPAPATLSGATPAPADAPRCPLTRDRPDWFLFSDATSAGAAHVYYATASGVALVHAAIAGAEASPTAPAAPATVTSVPEMSVPDVSASGVSVPTTSIPVPAAPASSAYVGYRGKKAWALAKDAPAALRRDGASALHAWSLPAETLAHAVATHLGWKGARSLIDLACGDGTVLDAFTAPGDRVTFGLESDPAAAAVARSRGHEVVEADAFDAPLVVPDGRTFDVVMVGLALQRSTDALSLLRRAKLLLNPRGLILVTADNLDSRLVDLFGPTWAGWDPEHNRTIVSTKAVKRMATAAGLGVLSMHTRTYAWRAAQSVARNRTGVLPAPDTLSRDDLAIGQRVAGWANLMWDWRQRGDVIHAVLVEAE